MPCGSYRWQTDEIKKDRLSGILVIAKDCGKLETTEKCSCFFNWVMIHKRASQVALELNNLPADARDVRDTG